MVITASGGEVEFVTIRFFATIGCEKHHQRFSAAYSGYEQYPQFVLPTVFDISANDGENNIKIKANFQQILFNRPQEVNMSVPSRYQVVVLGE